jgi:hypothetical protein
MKMRARDAYEKDLLSELAPMRDLPEEVSMEAFGELRDKLTAMKSAIRGTELRLLGYEWDKSGNKFVFKGNALTGKDTASKFVGLLDAFSSEINLISKREFQKWVQQRYELATTFNEWCLNAPDVPSKNQKVVLKMFRNALQTLADVSLHSKPTMDKIFGSPDELTQNRGNVI